MATITTTLADVVRDAARPLTGHQEDYDDLMELIGDARVVLIGEASHGTHEFFHERARITRRLIEEKGFSVVAVEGDWPDCYRVNRFVRGHGPDASADAALSDFQRFPAWMWRNVDVLTFVDWLRGYNDSLAEGRPRVGFYGLDLYSLYASMHAVVDYLERVDPEAARRARYRYACFDHFGEDAQAYGFAAEVGATRSCEDEAVQQLQELRLRAGEYAFRDGGVPEDEHFYAEQNARLVKNAEEYYRSMFRRRDASWNLRDAHMAETLGALVDHFDGERGGERTRVVVWEHNSHVGDARATEMGDQGEWTVGQLARERFGGDAVLVGFSTFSGTVTAADDWDAPARRKQVRPGLAGSYETLFHGAELPNFLLPIRAEEELADALRAARLERAIGVIYRPETERLSHYFNASLSEQFDAVIHIDETTAVVPLEPTREWHAGEGRAPDTFPSGI
ncbi:MAG TPA: erythromycin esterase family protein [Longimicrobiaceae bacterium]|nr:erythromycin esterase family protein [Longimicrobiaceae bacterium]